MGNQQIRAELDDLQHAVDTLGTGVVEEITSLSRDFTHFLQSLHRDAWSAEDACLDFGTKYVAAIEAYDQVLQGVRQDVVRYRDELQATHDLYRNADDSAADQMNLRIAAMDDYSEGNRMGGIAYRMRPTLEFDSTQPASAPPTDTSPGQ